MIELFKDEKFDMRKKENTVGNRGVGRPKRNYHFVKNSISYEGSVNMGKEQEPIFIRFRSLPISAGNFMGVKNAGCI